MKKVAKNTKENLKESKKDNHVTMPVFEKNMRNIANSFAKIDERLDKHEKIFDVILSEIRTITSTFKENKLNISDIDIHVIKHDRSIKSLDTRVDVLERKIK